MVLIQGSGDLRGSESTEEADQYFGSPANDTVFGLGGDDFLSGGDGQDILHGDAGDDALIGGNAKDFLFGGAGNDFLQGNAGDDFLFGGPGSDRFVFSSLSSEEGIDTIYDFQAGQGDKIQIFGSSFGIRTTQAFSFDSSTGALSADGVQFAVLPNSVNGANGGFNPAVDINIV